jgi:tetratricopeptide (TPR) repeat protein
MVLGSGTYIRNMAWATEKSLWEDAAQKAPKSSRPYYRLAELYSKSGRLDQSAALLQKGFPLRHHLPQQGQVLYYNNMGNIFRKKQAYEKAILYFKTALEIQPNFTTVRENLLLALIESNKWNEASKQVDILITKRYPRSFYLNLKGLIRVRQHSPAKAMPYFRKSLQRAPDARDSLLNFGAALSLTGAFDRADGVLTRAKSLYPNDALILLWLVENNLKAGRKNTAAEYLDDLLTAFSTDKLINFLQEHSKNNFSIPLSTEFLVPAIVDRTEAKVDKFAEMNSSEQNM